VVALEPGLYVRIQELQQERAPQPLPLSSGFSATSAYRVLGIHCASETSEAYLIMINDRDEVWFISNKHTRAHAIMPETRQFSVPLGNVYKLRER
jgi:hypothetical protein